MGDGRARQALGRIDKSQIAALSRNHLAELRPGEAAVEDICQQRTGVGLMLALARQQHKLGAEGEAKLHEVGGAAAAQRPDRLLHFQGVADVVAERLLHGAEHGGHTAPGVATDRHHALREQARIGERVHKRAAAVLHIEHDAVGASGELLTHHAGRDQRDRLDRRGDIAQGIKFFIGGGELAALSGHNQAHLAHDLAKLGGIEGGAQAGDAL